MVVEPILYLYTLYLYIIYITYIIYMLGHEEFRSSTIALLPSSPALVRLVPRLGDRTLCDRHTLGGADEGRRREGGRQDRSDLTYANIDIDIYV